MQSFVHFILVYFAILGVEGRNLVLNRRLKDLQQELPHQFEHIEDASDPLATDATSNSIILKDFPAGVTAFNVHRKDNRLSSNALSNVLDSLTAEEGGMEYVLIPADGG